jgi:protein-disulfide isomerase
MIRSKELLAAIALVAAASTPGWATSDVEPVTKVADVNYLPNTGNELLELIQNCESDACMSYVWGVVGGAHVYSIMANNPSPFCATGDVDEKDLLEAISATIQSTPMLHESHPALSVMTAFGRYWPCMTSEEISDIQSTNLVALNPEAVENLIQNDSHALILGDPDAPYEKSMLVFHDPNCNHCRRFRDETDKLVELGWKITIFPVATSVEESAGYGAVEIALRDIAPKAVEALHASSPENLADITLAMKIAQDEGVATKDILTAIAKSGAYQAVEANTEAFFAFGAQGTPSFIIGHSMYSGFMTAAAIEDLAIEIANAEAEADEVVDEPQQSTQKADQ